MIMGTKYWSRPDTAMPLSIMSHPQQGTEKQPRSHQECHSYSKCVPKEGVANISVWVVDEELVDGAAGLDEHVAVAPDFELHSIPQVDLHAQAVDCLVDIVLSCKLVRSLSVVYVDQGAGQLHFGRRRFRGREE